MVESIEKLPVSPAVPVYYKGDFDLEPIYRACIEWMHEHKVEFVYEKKYKDKEAGPGIRDIIIILVGNVKLDEFRRWNIKLTINTWEMKTLDQIAPSGNPLLSGRMELLLGSDMEIDYQGAYGSDTFIVSNMRKLMRKVWLRGNPGKEISTMEWKLQDLASRCRKILGVEII